MVSLLLSACTSATVPEATIISTAGTIGVGEQRILVEFSDVLAGDVIGVMRDENGSPLDRADGIAVDLVPGERLAYSFTFDIPRGRDLSGHIRSGRW